MRSVQVFLSESQGQAEHKQNGEPSNLPAQAAYWLHSLAYLVSALVYSESSYSCAVLGVYVMVLLAFSADHECPQEAPTACLQPPSW